MSSRPAAVLAVVALLVLSSFGGVAQVGDSASTPSPNASATNAPPADSYVIEQDGFCQQIEPLSSGGTVESFYDYRNHETHPEGVDRMYSSYGTEHLQEDDTSILFLHEGTDGVSLVTVHDRVDGNSSGGVATFDIVGLPAESEWVVQNDNYTGETNMAEWYSGDGWLGASWIWAEERTDGGAINGGLNDAFAATIHPMFNEDAEHYDNDDLYDPDYHDDGEIDDWEILSGDADNPDRTDIPSLDEPVTIRTGTCDGPSVSYELLGSGSGPDGGDADAGVAAAIENANPDDQIHLQPTAGSGDEVRFDDVYVSGLDDDTAVTFENNHPDDLPDTPDDVPGLGSLAVAGEPALENVSATVTFTVDETALEEHGIAPEDVSLYEQEMNESAWNESTTEYQGSSGSSHEYAASVESLEGLTVAQAQPEPESGLSAMPGFGGLGSLVAIAALIGLLAVRYRE
ncbi:uncharacterized protein Nmag_3425 [Natrialba magadii ATCC 43099]|uniref:PGF-pre-PGF domain-containing protein n=1 Tax=Natrialba magadii (strain ATCC 43099 / DSM 3394 / CCM 3739 / CIP 104546 / IAM 13178 / JCM 8861 / NBRC 102185 / NCIMB 2190 / MS3) TaxID=547559 RepID=D3STA8_NATMM|nr:hypothetical protein [Natrialba magadii]ADD06975.1 uncharacterized protein Nmag_3425 [Natrialba magadii ATCC 43099]ELY28882.1 hypothetical protein C500_13090 [Natrialba magadii ATCC 43099]